MHRPAARDRSVERNLGGRTRPDDAGAGGSGIAGLSGAVIVTGVNSGGSGCGNQTSGHL